jgi:hypothetical protein
MSRLAERLKLNRDLTPRLLAVLAGAGGLSILVAILGAGS